MIAEIDHPQQAELALRVGNALIEEIFPDRSDTDRNETSARLSTIMAGPDRWHLELVYKSGANNLDVVIDLQTDSTPIGGRVGIWGVIDDLPVEHGGTVAIRPNGPVEFVLKDKLLQPVR